MPVSVCESTANAVNAALRDSLGVGCTALKGVGNSVSFNESRTGNTALHNGGGGNRATGGEDDSDEDVAKSFQNRLVANAKRVLLANIEYEEVNNYSATVLDHLKSKYIVIKPDDATISSTGTSTTYQNVNGKSNNGYNNNKNSNNANTNGHESSAADTNGNSTNRSNSKSPAPPNGKQQQLAAATAKSQPNPNELPTPKRVLFARENVRIGWKHPGSRKWNVGVGMMNVGNTCYLNSTLQAIFHVPAMANWLLSDTAHMERCESGDGTCIICAMARTLQASQSHQSAIRPYMVYSKLKSICRHLVMGRQEDAHEFLRFLVEAMEKSYLTRFRNFKELDQYSKETTPLNQILGGYLKSAVRCLSCGHVSVTFQHFQDLLLDIRKADTIEDALETYFARERLEDTGYKCESCKKKVSATKQFSLERAPIALCIQLKRFSIVGTKINKQIIIKPRLDLSKFATRKTPGEPQLTYKLVAMITHLGVSQHCGHYTAIGLTESGTYYNYDDSYVRPISVQSVCNTNAYIIFYEIDNANSLKSQTTPSCTQVSGTTNSSPKTNGIRLSNGHIASPQRNIIGPQLPPGGLASYNAKSGSATSTTPNNSGNQKQPQQQQNGAASSNKITIHFKNGQPSLVKNSASSMASSNAYNTTNGVSSKQQQQQQQQQNGLLSGTGKFQESAHAKHTLASPSSKGQTVAVTNGNKSSSTKNAYASADTSESDPDDDDGANNIDVSNNKGSAATQNKRKLNTSPTPYSKPTLPSMPKLFDITPNGKKINHSTPQNHKTQQQQNFKSLVPYESASDDDEPTTTATTTTTTTLKHSTTETNAKRMENSLKRHNSDSSSTLSSDNEEDATNVKKTNEVNVTNNSKVAKKSVNSFKYYNAISPSTPTPLPSPKFNSNNNNNNANKQQKTDAIDEIFKNAVQKRNGSNSPTKKTKINQLQNNAATATNSDSEQSDADEDNNVDNVQNGTTTAARTNNRPFKRSKVTQPSPPVIKSKVGLWQVTQNDDNDESGVAITTKNMKNPFAAKAADSLGIKRGKVQNGKQQNPTKRIGNGYQQDAASNSAVSELLKQSHRGYGEPVFTWNGTQNDIEKEHLNLINAKRIEDDDDVVSNDDFVFIINHSELVECLKENRQKTAQDEENRILTGDSHKHNINSHVDQRMVVATATSTSTLTAAPLSSPPKVLIIVDNQQKKQVVEMENGAAAEAIATHFERKLTEYFDNYSQIENENIENNFENNVNIAEDDVKNS